MTIFDVFRMMSMGADYALWPRSGLLLWSRVVSVTRLRLKNGDSSCQILGAMETPGKRVESATFRDIGLSTNLF